MSRSLDTLRIVLIQARNTSDMELQEQQCFAERCRVVPEQFVTANVAHDPISLDLLHDADAVMIGGAGEYSALDDYAWMANLHELVRACVDRALPLFGSCWGHQVIACALGGTVIHDEERAEFGCGDIILTAAGQADPLFAEYPTVFRANLGHHDRVTELPKDAVELAYNNSQRNQAFRLAGLPIYGTQFHSELDAERERERLVKYRPLYISAMGGEEAFQAALDSLAPTTEADHLLHDFLVAYAT